MNSSATRSTVLALRYRPARFEQLVGQPHVVQALSHALTSQRLHHAYLFTGTRGVGKTTVSRILAKSLNCTGADGQGGITASPCGVCPACRDIDAGRFVDYVELDAASNRGVDEISQLLDQAVYKPVVGRFKVYMIDEVHMLSNHAFNAMLKTLEEPPDYLKFVLATTDPQKVPPTVLSRCLQFNLRPMAPETIQDHLVQVLAAEGVQAQAGALALISRAAQGSMRDALSLTDQAIAYTGGQLQEDELRRMLGTPDRGHVLALIGQLAAGDGAAVVASVDELRAQGAGAGALLEDMAWVLQQMAVLQLAPQAGVSASLSDSEAARVAELALVLPPEDTQLLYSLCLRGRQELPLAPDEYSGLIMVLLRLLAFRPDPNAGDSTREAGPVGRPAPARPTARAEQRTTAPRIATQVTPAAQMDEPLRPPVRAQVHVPVAEAAGPATQTVQPARGPDTAPADQPQGGHAPSRAGRDTDAEVAVRDAQHPSVLEANGTTHPSAGNAQELSDHVASSTAATFAMSDEAASLADQWESWVQQLCTQEAVHALPRELALQSVWVATQDQADGSLWELVCERETLAADHVASRLAAALSAASGRAVSLQVRTGPAQDTPAQRAAIRAADRQRAAEVSIRSDPLVTRLMQQFSSARIVPGSVRPL